MLIAVLFVIDTTPKKIESKCSSTGSGHKNGREVILWNTREYVVKSITTEIALQNTVK